MSPATPFTHLPAAIVEHHTIRKRVELRIEGDKLIDTDNAEGPTSYSVLCAVYFLQF